LKEEVNSPSMQASDHQQQLLRMLPGVDLLIDAVAQDSTFSQVPKTVRMRAIRETLAGLRRRILDQPDTIAPEQLCQTQLLARIRERIEALQALNLRRVINATGVVVHTNLGRSCLAPSVMAQLTTTAGRYSNLEFDLERGRRGSRYSAVEDLLCELSGSEAAMAVNNNAGAVLLCLDTLARDKEAIVSRGELVEIGGSFRIPDVMAKSGAILKEVGTTNRTHLRDYEKAIGDNTGLLLKVHTSNFSILGFTATVSINDLAVLGAKFRLPVMEDLGSGCFIDFSRYGLKAEPTVQASVSAGADVVTFSGDKLLGGPQAGLIVGKRPILEQIKANPLTRALRIDKLTLAALEGTLRLYRDEAAAIAQIPTLAMLTARLPELEGRANRLAQGLRALTDDRLDISLMNLSSRAGGGSLPLLELPSRCVGIRMSDRSVNAVEKALRRSRPPVIGRIENGYFIMDPRTLTDDEIPIVIELIRGLTMNLSTPCPGDYQCH
jgi:L-seryl-tRNA(Ser) seleniumtransferase